MTALAVSVVGSGRLARLRSAGGGWLVVAATLMLVAFVLAAVLAPVLAPYDPDLPVLGNVLAPIGAQHLLGTDQVGRDTFSRLLFGARTSLVGPLAVVVFATVLGVAAGLLAGWRGGWVDAAVSRVLDILFAFPGLLLAILAVSMFGKGVVAPVIAMAIAYTPFVARQVRGLVQTAKARPFVAAYAVQGFGAFSIATLRVLPNIAPTMLAQATVLFGYALLDLASLSFLGLGVQPPTADWGAMINQSRGAVLLGQPLSAVVPSVMVILTVVAFNVVGEELGDRIAKRDR
jgi:peptide/nickel transport system permease protein